MGGISTLIQDLFFTSRNKKDAQFTVLCIWLLNCFTKNVPNKYENHALMLKSLLSRSNVPGTSQSADNMITLSLDRLEETNWTVGELKQKDYLEFLTVV